MNRLCGYGLDYSLRWVSAYSGLKRSLSFSEGSLKSGRDDAGQMISDIVRFARNENTHDVKWVFSNELIEGGISKAELQQKVINMVTNDDLHPDTVLNVQRALGYINNKDVLDEELWDEFVGKFTGSIDDFVEIQSSFPNILSVLES